MQEGLDVVGANTFTTAVVNAAEGGVGVEGWVEAERLAVLLDYHFTLGDCV